uniref:Putative tail tubular protein n=1 Tax=viral metagenome TaxID=1070528 RepID=A0A6M3IK79_9ZZZZ
MTGIVGPELQSQTNADWYDKALEDANGFLVTPTGALCLIPGTIYVANTKANVKVRLERFIFSEDDVYILEVGPLYIRFYRDDGQMAGPLEVTTTYTAAQIFELDMSVQLADTLYIYHTAHPTRKLVRSADTAWTLTDLAMTDGPYRKENTSATTLTCAAVTGAGIALSASTDTFDTTSPSKHIGAIWKISHKVTMATKTGSFGAVANSASAFVQRNNAWNIVAIPSADFNGAVDVQFSDDDITFTTEMNVTQGTSTERQARSGIATDASIYVRLRCSDWTAGSCTYWIYADAYKHNGVVLITAVASAQAATVTVLTDLAAATATTQWAEGSWSPLRGYPGCGFFYNQRLGSGGNLAEPQEIWLSETDDLESHFPGSLATSAFHQALDGTMPSPIRWIRVEGKGLIIGTLGQVLSYTPQDVTQAANPATPNPFKKQNAVSHPNGFVRPVTAGSSILMLQLGGNAVMELLFSSEESALIAPDLTRFIKHLTRVDDANGIVSMAFQQRPYPILWCVRSDGTLLAFLYDRASEQAAWTYVTFRGTYESVQVIPKGVYDQVWLASLHTINSSAVRFVCRMDQLDINKPLKDMHYVEAGLSWKGGTANITGITSAAQGVITLDAWPADGDSVNMANTDNFRITGLSEMTELNQMVFTASDINVGALTLKFKDSESVGYIDTSGFAAETTGGVLTEVENTFGGLTHLEGEDVYVTTDGNSSETSTVASAAIPALDDYYNSVSIGLYDTRRIVPMPLEGPKSLGRGKHVRGLLFGAHRALGGRYGPMSKDGTLDAAKRRNLDWSKAQDPQDWETIGHTGIMQIMDSWRGKRTRIVIEQPEPLNFTLTMIEANIEVD